MGAQKRTLSNADQDSPFRSEVNLVLVPVVVRDAHLRPVGNLTQGDFQLFDRGKQQNIVSFSAVRRPNSVREDVAGPTTASSPARTAADAVHATDSIPAGQAAAHSNPQRHFIYVFDDLNTRFADMANVRTAALGHFQHSLTPTDQAAIYTFSGRTTLEFTNQQEKLAEAVAKLRWQMARGQGGMECPDVSYYLADLIITKAQGQALQALVHHTAECAHVRPEIALQIALDASNRELIIGAQNTDVALRTLRRAIRRLSSMPGERAIILSSPGFFAQTSEATKATTEVLDLAAKSNVIISGLSVRGVIVADEEEDVTRRTVPPRNGSPTDSWVRYRRESAQAEGDVMKDLAEGTGGTFFHNNNNLQLGFERVATSPEFSYVLGFSPTPLKEDGSYHSIRVRLPGQERVNIEARRGYYAIKNDTKDRMATLDIDNAVFSRDQVNDIPVVLQTGYSKPNTGDTAKVLAAAKIYYASLHFQKAEGRSSDSLRVVLTIFDPDGGYVAGETKTVNLKLREETLAQKDPGLNLNWEFEVRPGSYLVRLVIREAGGKAMTTVNRTVSIN
jgi:VWFA-related protein